MVAGLTSPPCRLKEAAFTFCNSCETELKANADGIFMLRDRGFCSQACLVMEVRSILHVPDNKAKPANLLTRKASTLANLRENKEPDEAVGRPAAKSTNWFTSWLYPSQPKGQPTPSAAAAAAAKAPVVPIKAPVAPVQAPQPQPASPEPLPPAPQFRPSDRRSRSPESPQCFSVIAEYYTGDPGTPVEHRTAKLAPIQEQQQQIFDDNNPFTQTAAASLTSPLQESLSSGRSSSSPDNSHPEMVAQEEHLQNLDRFVDIVNDRKRKKKGPQRDKHLKEISQLTSRIRGKVRGGGGEGEEDKENVSTIVAFRANSGCVPPTGEIKVYHEWFTDTLTRDAVYDTPSKSAAGTTSKVSSFRSKSMSPQKALSPFNPRGQAIPGQARNPFGTSVGRSRTNTINGIPNKSLSPQESRQQPPGSLNEVVFSFDEPLPNGR